MRILLSNKFFYPRGGDCIHTMQLKELLEKNGHEVAVFAMQFPENLEHTYAAYWPSEVSFVKKSPQKILASLIRPFGVNEVKKKWTKLLDDFRPDIVHLHNIHSHLSPLIAQIAHSRGIRVVWTMHDYKLLCPRSDCLLNDVQVCELCFNDKKHVLKNRCTKNSLLASMIAYGEAKKWTKEKLEKYTYRFICPSSFMASKMVSGGFDAQKVVSLCNFINVQKTAKNAFQKQDYYCYVGRLSTEKGLKTLVQAASQLPYPLKIIGGGALMDDLKNRAGKNIEFLGFKNWDEIKEVVGNARFAVIPSEWYENNPLSVIEAQCLGTPVLGANIGGIPELMQLNALNMVFEPGNVNDLCEKITAMWSRNYSEQQYHELADLSAQHFHQDNYYKKLMNIYQE